MSKWLCDLPAGIQAVPHSDPSMLKVLSGTNEDGQPNFSRAELLQHILDDCLFDSTAYTPWDTWRLFAPHPSHVVEHIDAADCASIVQVLEQAAAAKPLFALPLLLKTKNKPQLALYAADYCKSGRCRWLLRTQCAVLRTL